MKEGMLEVLMYLFQNHIQGNNVTIKEENLMLELQRAGFDVSEIENALDWLDGLAECSEMINPDTVSFRILSTEERLRLNAECWGFISYLEQVGILDFMARETVIDRLMNLNTTSLIDIPHIKWVTLMVLFQLNDRKDALKAMENLVLTCSSEQLH